MEQFTMILDENFQIDSKNHKFDITIPDEKNIVRTLKKALNNGVKLGDFERRGVRWSG